MKVLYDISVLGVGQYNPLAKTGVARVIMVNPKNTDELCHSILEIYNTQSLRADMSLKSLEQSKKFSWEKCTQETIESYKFSFRTYAVPLYMVKKFVFFQILPLPLVSLRKSCHY